jgi:hypothetical protein
MVEEVNGHSNPQSASMAKNQIPIISIRRWIYHFFVKGGTDSELNGSQDASP